MGDYTIEVRSSFVRNGIDFALFGRDKNDNGDSYFDVLGPYHNSYKPCEIYKDYYMRVFYEGEKKDFMKGNSGYIYLYITGGATKEMMKNKRVSKIKHLLPGNTGADVESDYMVVPMSRSLDIQQFLNQIPIETKNNLNLLEPNRWYSVK